MRIIQFLSALAVALPAAHSLSSTDSYRDGDVPQSGYETTHNFDPTKLSQFKQNWRVTFNAGEVFYAKPLVYTPAGDSYERVYTASNQNWIRVLDSRTGNIIASRQLAPPFQSSDTDCGDIANTIGVIGTPIIDPATEIMYLWSKSYKGGATGPFGASGVFKGDMQLYALKLSDLSNAPGFPVSINGMSAFNDHARYLIPGTMNQRPGLAMVGDTIVTGFGSHCMNFNYTGFLVTASKTAGVGIRDIQAMAAPPGAPSPQATDIRTSRNGRSSIWQAGFGLATDASANRVFFATGNGQSPGELKGDNGSPKSGKTLLSTLMNAVASYGVNPTTGKLSQLDWFVPANYDHLNGGDRDVGSSGVALLDPNPFSGGGVNRIAIAAGKSGTVFILDADNLGGFKMGDGQSDNYLQLIQPNGVAFFSGIASYPLEGGYIYFVPTGDRLYAYKFGISNGKPQFTLAGKTNMVFAGKGAPRVTSLGGKPGTGIVWLTDVNQGLVAFNAVPDSNGVLQQYTLPLIGRLTKFQRPIFGNSAVYTTENNQIIAVGGPAGTSPNPGTTVSQPGTTSSAGPRSTPSTSTSSTSTTSSKATSSSTTSTSKSSSSTTSLSTSKPTTSSSTSSSLKPYSTPAPPSGKRVTLNWNINWVNAAPDGVKRPMIGINGQWPCPPIILNYGDKLTLNIVNGLGNESTAIHFHGLHQRGNNLQDGPSFSTQCPIPPGSSFVYQLTAAQVGTYWYHAHHGGQYIDGFRGPLIIKDPSPPYGKIDQDLTLTLTDHHHDQAPDLIHYYQSPENTDMNGGAEPTPQSALMNEAQNTEFNINPGQTHLFRIINTGAMAGFYLQFDQHSMTIVEVDGQYVQPYEVQQLFIAVAQRYGVLIKAKADKSQNYAIVATMNPEMFGMDTVTQNPTVTGWLVYDAAKPMPGSFTLEPQPFDDSAIIPLDQQKLMDPAELTIPLTASFNPDLNGITRGYFSGISFVPQKVPTLYTVLTAPDKYLNNANIYGVGANPYILPYGAVVEVTINNHDDRAHPFHLHGHVFQIISRSDSGDLWPGLYSPPAMPLKRDTVTVYGQGTAVIRFVADNPGVQLFHCHTEWHVVAGLTATFVEAPPEMAAQKPHIPSTHKNVCDKLGIPRKGNAAGNSKNWLDLTGANTETPVDNWGALVK